MARRKASTILRAVAAPVRWALAPASTASRIAVSLSSAVFFFFQAADGIRHATVTGVQTCALPISRGGRGLPGPQGQPDHDAALGATHRHREQRSEERRVGKECRARGWRYHEE